MFVCVCAYVLCIGVVLKFYRSTCLCEMNFFDGSNFFLPQLYMTFFIWIDGRKEKDSMFVVFIIQPIDLQRLLLIVFRKSPYFVRAISYKALTTFQKLEYPNNHISLDLSP